MKSRFLTAAVIALFSSAAIGSDWPFSSASSSSQQSLSGQGPDNSGPIKLLCASWLGGPGDDDIAGVSIAPDGSIFFGMNGGINAAGVAPTMLAASASDTAPAAASPSVPLPAATIVHLTGNGQRILGLSQFSPGSVELTRLRGDTLGNIYILADAKSPLQIGQAGGTGTFVAMLDPGARQIKWAIFQPGAIDFGIDGNGDAIILTKGHMTRYKPGVSQPVWQVTMPSHGDNRPGGMTVDPNSGVAAATGYGMARTGHEPYKDPYAYGFDRSGKQLWALWNPDPTREAAAQYGGNGLMADTTGAFCGTDSQGKILLGLRADGGNTVTSRDPSDPFKPLDPSVFAGVFQPNAGFGFHGASMSSVILRLDAASGKLEKATYMTAWLTPARANGLRVLDATGDGTLQFVVGDSAAGFRSKAPWYVAPPGGYTGGGFLAVFDSQFQMVQAGYFPGSNIHCIAARNGVIVVAGSAVDKNTASDKSTPNAPATTYPVPSFNAIQPTFGGGKGDGYFAIFKITH